MLEGEKKKINPGHGINLMLCCTITQKPQVNLDQIFYSTNTH